MATQWRHGMNGPTGLDYSALPVVLKLEAVPKKNQQDVFDCIRAMEGAALCEIHKKEA